jgi:hypothetical protein
MTPTNEWWEKVYSIDTKSIGTELKELKDCYGEPKRGELMGADKNSSRRR